MTIAEAESFIDAYERHAERYAALAHRESEMEAERIIVKQDAINRLLGLTKPDGKPHSYTSAETCVELDAEYAGFLATIRNVIREKRAEEAHMTAAKLRARLTTAVLADVL